MKRIKKEELAYAAGIFDGEGHISLMRLAKPSRKLARPAYGLDVQVTNTDRPVLEFFRDRFGGRVKSHSMVEGRKPTYRWQVTGKKIDNFLVRVQPYIRIRKLQVKYALDFRKSIRRRKIQRARLIPEEIRYREFLRRKINARGGT